MQTTRKLSFQYPLTRDQMGTPLGNGYLGALVWGEGRLLHISFGCSALWDHRGGMHWSERQNYKDIFQALKDGTEDVAATFSIQMAADRLAVMHLSLQPGTYYMRGIITTTAGTHIVTQTLVVPNDDASIEIYLRE